MTEYTLDVNGKRYALNESFRSAIQQRAKREYEGNPLFTCWWSVANPDNYTESEWENNIHDAGDPILVIETRGKMVPWDSLDQLEARKHLPEGISRQKGDDDDETEDIDAGNGMKTVPPADGPDTNNDIFSRTHFPITPHRYDGVPEPEGEDPTKVPPAPDEVGDDPELIIWLPRHPELDHTWSAGEAITSISSWVEWNVQKRADQPDPTTGAGNIHDAFESLCLIYDCEKIGEYTPSNDIPEGSSGQVERKGEAAYEDGKYGGGHWHV